MVVGDGESALTIDTTLAGCGIGTASVARDKATAKLQPLISPQARTQLPPDRLGYMNLAT